MNIWCGENDLGNRISSTTLGTAHGFGTATGRTGDSFLLGKRQGLDPGTERSNDLEISWEIREDESFLPPAAAPEVWTFAWARCPCYVARASRPCWARPPVWPLAACGGTSLSHGERVAVGRVRGLQPTEGGSSASMVLFDA